jgi:hypothetical protein
MGNVARYAVAASVALVIVASGAVAAAASASTVATVVGDATSEFLYASTLDWNTGNGSIFVYHAYGFRKTPFKTIPITTGFVEGLWTDAHGNLYAAVVNAGTNGRGYVTEYAPGGTRVLRTLTAGLDGPSGGAFDANGNMYVSNLCGTLPSLSCNVFARTRLNGLRPGSQGSGYSGYVGVYPPGASQPSYLLQSPINIAVNVAVDRANNVFVADNTGRYAWDIIEFRAGARTGTVVKLDGQPKNLWVGSVSIDPVSGSLVAGLNDTVQYFPKEGGKASEILTSGVVSPDGLAWGPDDSLFIGNYEFEQNEGNIVVYKQPDSPNPGRSYSVPYNNGVVSIAVGPSAH